MFEIGVERPIFARNARHTLLDGAGTQNHGSAHLNQYAARGLAREAALSTWHFHRLFTGTFGSTPHDFLTELRIGRARQLLASGSYSVTETCFETGYSSLGSFSTRFRDVVGLSPGDYSRQVRRVFGPAAPARSQFIPTCFLSLYAGLE